LWGPEEGRCDVVIGGGIGRRRLPDCEMRRVERYGEVRAAPPLRVGCVGPPTEVLGPALWRGREHDVGDVRRVGFPNDVVARCIKGLLMFVLSTNEISTKVLWLTARCAAGS
jgi:hypothetical protein